MPESDRDFLRELFQALSVKVDEIGGDVREIKTTCRPCQVGLRALARKSEGHSTRLATVESDVATIRRRHRLLVVTVASTCATAVAGVAVAFFSWAISWVK